jgi:hypothetical protein
MTRAESDDDGALERAREEESANVAQANWGAVLAKAKAMGLTPALARKILDMNPKLRQAGFDTVSLVAQSNAAEQSKGAPRKEEPPAERSVFALLAERRRDLDERQAQAEREIARLKGELDAYRRTTCGELTRWLMANDRELRSPVTQQALSEENDFLICVGFSVKDYVALIRREARK